MLVKFKAIVLPSSPMANGWYVQGLDTSSIGRQDQALVVAVHHDLKERSGRRQGENPSRGYRKICWKYSENREKVDTQWQILGKHKNESEFNFFCFPNKKNLGLPNFQIHIEQDLFMASALASGEMMWHSMTRVAAIEGGPDI